MVDGWMDGCWVDHLCMYFTPIRFGILSRTNQIAACIYGSFFSYFFKKITLSRRDEPCSKSVSQSERKSVKYVCLSHQSGLRYYIRTNEIAVYKGEVIWHSCKRAISFEDFRFVGGGIGELWINPGFETLACLQRTRRQQRPNTKLLFKRSFRTG